ncbi:MAG: SoxR reducing system RseC family protein [Prevotellaceae bacterium]|jgi:hypothetical protein|nr:SoxR reducing system RseC family protein [Prevotellaceae bacterium]
MPKQILHSAVVESVDEDGITVSLKSSPRSASAHGHSHLIYLSPDDLHCYSAGDNVTVVETQLPGQKAFTLVYLTPVAVLVGSLLLLLAAGLPKGAAGISSLGVLALYYLALYVFRRKLDKVSCFSVETAPQGAAGSNAAPTA